MRHSIGKEKAIELYKSGWWKGKTDREIARFQLFTGELCCPFDIFHKAIEASLGRPVFTHEFGLNYDGLVQEFLDERDAPTLEQVMELIPSDKRIVVVYSANESAE